MLFYIIASPYFATPSRLVTARKSDTALLRCDVNGDKPLNVIWLRGGKTELNPSSNFRVHIKQDVTPEGVTSELQIVNADTSDSGAYFCQASNMYGREQQLVQLLVQEPPASPQNPEADIITSTSVNLKWRQEAESSEDVLKFILEYREIDSKYLNCLIYGQKSFEAIPKFSITLRLIKVLCFYCFELTSLMHLL